MLTHVDQRPLLDAVKTAIDNDGPMEAIVFAIDSIIEATGRVQDTYADLKIHIERWRQYNDARVRSESFEHWAIETLDYIVRRQDPIRFMTTLQEGRK